MKQPRRAQMDLQAGGPASHQPALHYLGAEFDTDQMFRDLLNRAKDLQPDHFARHYFAAAQEHRELAAENAQEGRPFDREREVDELFGLLCERLLCLGLKGPVEDYYPYPPADEEGFIRLIASYCASLDVLQETN